MGRLKIILNIYSVQSIVMIYIYIYKLRPGLVARLVDKTMRN